MLQVHRGSHGEVHHDTAADECRPDWPWSLLREAAEVEGRPAIQEQQPVVPASVPLNDRRSARVLRFEISTETGDVLSIGVWSARVATTASRSPATIGIVQLRRHPRTRAGPILVLDPIGRHAVAAVRGLGRAGGDVVVADSERHADALAARSRYAED